MGGGEEPSLWMADWEGEGNTEEKWNPEKKIENAEKG